ncbi:DUF982 domain-containing protein [Sinorhizobium meliloti]|uniref:DUF982 domain-containing protein n=1 Tax=Rhizobium meliloti TaxID=382 RepID=UPI00299E47D6|nr:DUF982 domain-containing protein [Sinorhizobium meliloti]MDW9581118.1 DUF982 domain-containing protein [Sinorhizobium meliloti]MDW9654996.1 DUF982 domain-containing protein [Sinorhizobium meliloti]MDW9914195.1 DUF982 domain-containing protein [Sinorhizobium meliloti]MDW9941511.1 DUF982 domain-containing protein [Sinorhizobium meliloti]
MLLNEIPWTIPLTVRLSNGLTHTFASVYEALDFLENEWPLRKGERYERAVRTCRRALNRMTPAAVARESFIAACLEAGMPLVMAPPAREPQGDTVKAAHTA